MVGTRCKKLTCGFSQYWGVKQVSCNEQGWVEGHGQKIDGDYEDNSAFDPKSDTGRLCLIRK